MMKSKKYSGRSLYSKTTSNHPRSISMQTSERKILFSTMRMTPKTSGLPKSNLQVSQHPKNTSLMRLSLRVESNKIFSKNPLRMPLRICLPGQCQITSICLLTFNPRSKLPLSLLNSRIRPLSTLRGKRKALLR